MGDQQNDYPHHFSSYSIAFSCGVEYSLIFKIIRLMVTE